MSSITKKFLTEKKVKKKTAEQKKITKILKNVYENNRNYDESNTNQTSSSLRQKLTPAQKKKKIKIRDELIEHQNKCLEFIRNDNYKFKPDEKMIKRQERKNNEKLKPLFSEEDFAAFEREYLGGEKERKNNSKVKKSKQPIYF